MVTSGKQEHGEPTAWDAAWREGYAEALEAVLGVGYRQAWLMAGEYWQPLRSWRRRLARWLLRHATRVDP